MSARVYEVRYRRSGQRDPALPQGARDRRTKNLAGGRVARSDLPRRRALSRSCRRSCSRRPTSSRIIGREEVRAVPWRRRSRRTSSSGTIRRSPSTARSSISTRRTCRTIDALIKLYLALSRGGRTCSRCTRRKADLVTDAQEKKLIYYQIGAVFERELGDVAEVDRHVPARARDRSGRRPGARAARRALPDAPRTGRSCSASSSTRRSSFERSGRRESATSTGSPSCTRSTSTTRRARSSCTAICFSRCRITRPRSTALEGIKARGEGSARRRAGARADLRRDR